MNEFVNAALLDGMGLEAEYWVKLAQVYPGVYDDVQLLIGNEIRKRRKQAGLTQIQLANQIFCSATTISNIEHGYIFHNMAAFNSICQYFKLMSGSLIYLSQLYCLYHHHHKIEGLITLPPNIKALGKSSLSTEQALSKSSASKPKRSNKSSSNAKKDNKRTAKLKSSDKPKSAEEPKSSEELKSSKEPKSAEEPKSSEELKSSKEPKSAEELKSSDELKAHIELDASEELKASEKLIASEKKVK